MSAWSTCELEYLGWPVVCDYVITQCATFGIYGFHPQQHNSTSLPLPSIYNGFTGSASLSLITANCKLYIILYIDFATDAIECHCWHFFKYKPLAVRSLQTSASTTELQNEASATKPFSVKLHEDSFRSYLTDTPSLEVEVTKDMLIDMYTKMSVMRRMEMAADALYRQKLIRGFCHLATGQVCAQSKFVLDACEDI